MGTALHTIRVDHFDLGTMLHRLVALSELVEPDNHQDLTAPLALVLRFVCGRAASKRRRQTETLLREALFKAALETSPKGRITPIETRIRAGRRRELLTAFKTLASDGRRSERFRAATRSYAAFERWRMLQFDTQVIPLALARLDQDDWRRIDAAVERRKFSIRDRSCDREAEQLFREAMQAARAAQRRAATSRDPAGWKGPVRSSFLPR